MIDSGQSIAETLKAPVRHTFPGSRSFSARRGLPASGFSTRAMVKYRAGALNEVACPAEQAAIDTLEAEQATAAREREHFGDEHSCEEGVPTTSLFPTGTEEERGDGHDA